MVAANIGMPGMRHVRTYLAHSQIVMNIQPYLPGDWVEYVNPHQPQLRNTRGQLPLGRINRRIYCETEIWGVQRWARKDDGSPSYQIEYEKQWHTDYMRPAGRHYRDGN